MIQILLQNCLLVKFAYIAHNKIFTLIKKINQNDFSKQLVKSFSIFYFLFKRSIISISLVKVKIVFYVIKAYLSNYKIEFVSQIFVKLLKSLTTFFNGPCNHTHELLQVNVFTVNVTCTDKSLYRRKSSND